MRNIFFNPKTIALIGANERPGSVGLGVCRNLLWSAKGRKIFFVNPFEKIILGRKAYQNINSIKEKIDLAVIAVPANFVAQVAMECSQKKVGGVIIISAGFAEAGPAGKERQDRVASILAGKGIPLLGPNCLGVISPATSFNSSFSPFTPKQGPIAFLSQSGALIDSVIDQSVGDQYGFSALVSYGNEANLDISDFINFFKNDPKTKVISLYLESVKSGEKFKQALLATVKQKPVVVLKGGKTDLGGKAAASHTAALTGIKEVYSAVFRKFGVFEVETIGELLGVSMSLGQYNSCPNNIGILTNGGAIAVLLADWCSRFGVKLAKFSRKTLDGIVNSAVFNPAISLRNPMDILGDALSKRYEVAMDSILGQADVGGVIVAQTFQVMTQPVENAKAIARCFQKHRKPILVLLPGGDAAKRGTRILQNFRIPYFQEPKEAILAIKALTERKKTV